MSEHSRYSWSLTKNAFSKLRISRNLSNCPKILLSTLIAGLGLMVASRVEAQTFTTLYSFTGGSDGALPVAGLILSGNTAYGTAFWGGGSDYAGTVFAVNSNGTGFTNLYVFTNGSDGIWPQAGLILSGNTLCGTTENGGDFDDDSAGYGTVFAVNTNGMGFTTLYTFTNGSDGANPIAGLILSGNTLYGTASGRFGSDNGTIFKANTNGTCFRTLYTFTNGGDGSQPVAGLILSGNTLYGTASGGGTSIWGTIFAVNTNGTGFRTLHSFTGGDGGEPQAGLILSGDTLYGTASGGGSWGYGTVFAINTNGMCFTNLYDFTGGSDGWNPVAGLILSGNTLYGTAQFGGTSGDGTVFAVNTDGTGFTTLYSFTNGSDGGEPQAGLILSGNTLYGTASGGGSWGAGTVFSLSLPVPPQLAITMAGTNVILTWPTNAAGFTLESTKNLLPAAWSAVSPAPVVINGQNTVTNPVSGTHRFYQLSQ
jgi:uncharacterized repeat protein (TIGR03803 family)